jgi:hypothetical protein
VDHEDSVLISVLRTREISICTILKLLLLLLSSSLCSTFPWPLFFYTDNMYWTVKLISCWQCWLQGCWAVWNRRYIQTFRRNNIVSIFALKMDTKVSEKHAVSIFSMKMEITCISKTLVSTYESTRPPTQSTTMSFLQLWKHHITKLLKM